MAYCSICDKTFKTVQSLASHRYVYHKDVKPVKRTDNRVDTSLAETPLSEELEEKPKRLKINIKNAACYPKIVKWMCKCILQGDIPMTNDQKKLLKPEREIVRQIAEARVAQAQKLIHKQIRKHHKKGDSALGKLLEVVTSTLEAMFYS